MTNSGPESSQLVNLVNSNEMTFKEALAGKVIFIVEDDLQTFWELEHLLEEMKAKTIHARSAEAAIALLDSGMSFDLIILDIQLSGGSNGLDVIDHIRRHRLRAKIVLCSLHFGNPEYLIRIANYGLAGQIPKSFFDTDRVYHTVAAAVSNGRFVCDEHNSEQMKAADQEAAARIPDLLKKIAILSKHAHGLNGPVDYHKTAVHVVRALDSNKINLSWNAIKREMETWITDLSSIETENHEEPRLMSDPSQHPKEAQVAPKFERHLVILVHGINTRAQWMSSVGSALEDVGCFVAPTSYGRFGVIRFLAPITYFRRAPIDRVLRDVRSAIGIHSPTRISIISHSFGTYVVTRLMRENPDIKWGRVILCGSIVRDDFPVGEIIGRLDPPLLNEIGGKDYWPALAEIAGWGYGSVGSNGMNRPGCSTRWHADLAHSDFLTRDFCQKYWIPFLKTGEVVKASMPTQPPPWLQVVSFLPLRWLPLALLASMAFAAVYLVNLRFAL